MNKQSFTLNLKHRFNFWVNVMFLQRKHSSITTMVVGVRIWSEVEREEITWNEMDGTGFKGITWNVIEWTGMK